MVGNYGQLTYDGNIPRYSYIVWIMFHQIIMQIIMFPFIVTLLGELYEGFGVNESKNYYQLNWYLYINRFDTIIKSKHPSSEFLIHPPPLGILTLFLMPFIFSLWLLKISVWMYSLFNYWVENIFFILGFFFYILKMVPMSYLTLLVASLEYFPNFVSILYFISWLIVGIPLLLIYVFIDTYWFFRIL